MTLVEIRNRDRETVLINPECVADVVEVRGSIGLDGCHRVIRMTDGAYHTTHESQEALLRKLNGAPGGDDGR